MKWYQVQGKGVAHCHYCDRMRACKVLVNKSGDIPVCKPCIEERNLQIKEKNLGLLQAGRKVGFDV